jgi:organic radical activating enzyme
MSIANEIPKGWHDYNLYNVSEFQDSPNMELVEKFKSELYFKKCIPLIDVIETYQGEGPNCGKRMVLARFKYCNFKCPFCDTYNMMSNTNINRYSLKDIDVLLRSSDNLMITGGEPSINVIHSNDNVLYLSQFAATIYMASILNYEYLDIETNGTHIIELQQKISELCNINKINISWSPKFVSVASKKLNYTNLDMIMDNSIKLPTIKLVIGKDMDAYKEFAYNAIINKGYNPNNVYLMPKGTTWDEINESMEYVLDVASDIKCNVSSRLHVIHNFK